MDYEKLINDFNDGRSVEDIFGSLYLFFEFARRKKLLHLIDYEEDGHSREWINEFLIFLYENKQFGLFNEIVISSLNDVKIIDGKWYYFDYDRERLSNFFCIGSRNNPRYLAERIFGEGDMYDRFNETTDDVYTDVILELSNENLDKLKKIIITTLENVEVSPESELLESISQEQNSDFVTVNETNIDRIVDDNETMRDFLLKNELSDLRSNLYSLHHQSYANAYESDLWKEAWSELSRFFRGQGEFIQVPTNTKNDKTKTQFVIEFRDFYGLIMKFLYDNKGSSDTLYYEGSIEDVVYHLGDCLSLSVPDYPDSREVDKNINEFFNDYIY